jgi:hypothetical protein
MVWRSHTPKGPPSLGGYLWALTINTPLDQPQKGCREGTYKTGYQPGLSITPFLNFSLNPSKHKQPELGWG